MSRTVGGSRVQHRANDLVRTGALALLPPDDPEVVQDLKNASRAKKLSSDLLVLGERDDDRGLAVADGYHRICARHHLDSDSEIPYRIVNCGG